MEDLESGCASVASEAAGHAALTAGLLLHASEAMSAKRMADAMERIMDTLEDIRDAINGLNGNA